MTADLASAAFRLTLRQKAVFQLAQGSKEPMAGSRGHLDATLEVDVVRARVLFLCDTAKQASRVERRAKNRLPDHRTVALERAAAGTWGTQ
jgi:hypothetical protein